LDFGRFLVNSYRVCFGRLEVVTRLVWWRHLFNDGSVDFLGFPPPPPLHRHSTWLIAGNFHFEPEVDGPKSSLVMAPSSPSPLLHFPFFFLMYGGFFLFSTFSNPGPQLCPHPYGPVPFFDNPEHSSFFPSDVAPFVNSLTTTSPLLLCSGRDRPHLRLPPRRRPLFYYQIANHTKRTRLIPASPTWPSNPIQYSPASTTYGL